MRVVHRLGLNHGRGTVVIPLEQTVGINPLNHDGIGGTVIKQRHLLAHPAHWSCQAMGGKLINLHVAAQHAGLDQIRVQLLPVLNDSDFYIVIKTRVSTGLDPLGGLRLWNDFSVPSDSVVLVPTPGNASTNLRRALPV